MEVIANLLAKGPNGVKQSAYRVVKLDDLFRYQDQLNQKRKRAEGGARDGQRRAARAKW